VKNFYKGLLIVLSIAAAGLGYMMYKTDKPMPMHRGVTYTDLFNHVGPATHSEQYDDGTSMTQYEAVEDQVFKILHKGYPKRIKLYKTYTLKCYFDANGNSTFYKIEENPNSPLLGKDKN
jgi:hypothetical protein